MFSNIFQNLFGFTEYRLTIQTIIVILSESSETKQQTRRGNEMMRLHRIEGTSMRVSDEIDGPWLYSACGNLIGHLSEFRRTENNEFIRQLRSAFMREVPEVFVCGDGVPQ